MAEISFREFPTPEAQFPRMSLLGSPVNRGNPVSSKCAKIRWMASYALVKGFPTPREIGRKEEGKMQYLVTMEVIDVVDVGALLVGLVTLVVVVLALRSAQSAAQLAEARNEYLREEQKRLDQLREQHKTLNEELVRERQERWSLQEQLNQEQGQRLEAQRRAELAEQEALRGATQQLREQMDRYLKELEEDTQPGLVRRIK